MEEPGVIHQPLWMGTSSDFGMTGIYRSEPKQKLRAKNVGSLLAREAAKAKAEWAILNASAICGRCGAEGRAGAFDVKESRPFGRFAMVEWILCPDCQASEFARQIIDDAAEELTRDGWYWEPPHRLLRSPGHWTVIKINRIIGPLAFVWTGRRQIQVPARWVVRGLFEPKWAPIDGGEFHAR